MPITKTARIFIVEDEAFIAMELEDRLSGLGYSVCGHAASGESAFEQIPELEPDLILMDINLSGQMKGTELAQRLRAVVDVPIVFLTAFSDSRLVDEAIGTGSFSYLVKPFDVQALRANIEMTMYKHGMENKLRETLSKVTLLTGLLPVCNQCKKIQNDDGDWHSLESYVENHTGAQLSPGLCPECSGQQ